MERIAYIGIDVHKDTNTACLFAGKEREVLLQDIGTVPAGCGYMAKVIRKALKSYGLMDWDVLCGYKAGLTGYGLCKGLQKAGFKCVRVYWFQPETIDESIVSCSSYLTRSSIVVFAKFTCVATLHFPLNDGSLKSKQ